VPGSGTVAAALVVKSSITYQPLSRVMLSPSSSRPPFSLMALPSPLYLFFNLQAAIIGGAQV
jgi:hypothetical protein